MWLTLSAWHQQLLGGQGLRSRWLRLLAAAAGTGAEAGAPVPTSAIGRLTALARRAATINGGPPRHGSQRF